MMKISYLNFMAGIIGFRHDTGLNPDEKSHLFLLKSSDKKHVNISTSTLSLKISSKFKKVIYS